MLPHPAVSPPLREKFVLVGVSVWPMCVCERVDVWRSEVSDGCLPQSLPIFWGTQFLMEPEVHQFV